MAKILIASPELSDNATVASSASMANFDITNTQNIHLLNVARFNTKNFTIIYDFSNLTNISYNFVALIATNISPTGQFRIRTSNSTNFNSPLYNSGFINFWKHSNYSNWDSYNSFHHFEQIRQEHYLELTINDVNNPANFIEIGRVYVSNAWTPTYNMPYGWSIGWHDLSELEPAISGTKFTTIRPKYRELNFTIDFIDEDEMYDRAFAIDKMRGESKDLLVIPDRDKNNRIMDQMIYGLSSQLTPITNHTFHMYQKRYRIEELI